MTLERAFRPWFLCMYLKCWHNKGVCCGQWFWHVVLQRSQYFHLFQACVHSTKIFNFFLTFLYLFKLHFWNFNHHHHHCRRHCHRHHHGHGHRHHHHHHYY